MPELRNVLCPVDFSPWSDGAMRYAAWLCKQVGAQLTLLHVFETPAYASLPDGQNSVAMASIDESVRRLSQQLQRDLDAAIVQLDAGRPIRTRLLDGLPYRAIIDAAQELGVDLIVMGTQGRTGLSRLLLGSVAERVVRLSGCPVLTVPAAASAR